MLSIPLYGVYLIRQNIIKIKNNTLIINKDTTGISLSAIVNKKSKFKINI